MAKAYFATDGSWGNAEDIIIIEIDDDVIEDLNEMTDDDRYQWASEQEYAKIMLDDPNNN